MWKWIARIWNNSSPTRWKSKELFIEQDKDAELAALIEGDDISEAKLERMADLFGQSDPNADKFR